MSGKSTRTARRICVICREAEVVAFSQHGRCSFCLATTSAETMAELMLMKRSVRKKYFAAILAKPVQKSWEFIPSEEDTEALIKMCGKRRRRPARELTTA